MFVLKIIWGVALQAALFGLLLFVPARTLVWPRAWILVEGIAAATVATMFYLRNQQDLVKERLKGPFQKGQPVADKIVLNLLVLMLCCMIAFIPLVVFRLHLIGAPGMFVSLVGLGLIVAGWSLAAVAMHENAFAAGVVRYQQERHHRVVDRGVYYKLRHPMYAGGVAFIVGIPLWLGSYAAALLAVLPISLLAVRIHIEESFLRQTLEGYQAYVERTRYRLIPYVW